MKSQSGAGRNDPPKTPFSMVAALPLLLDSWTAPGELRSEDPGSGRGTAPAIIVGILISALILTAAALPIYYRILKSGNDRREENLYAREDRFKKK